MRLPLSLCLLQHLAGLYVAERSILSVLPSYFARSTHLSMKTLFPTPLASPISTSLANTTTTTLFTDTIPQPQALGSSSRQANWLSPRRRGSCHISKLASPPPDKSCIPPSFNTPLYKPLFFLQLRLSNLQNIFYQFLFFFPLYILFFFLWLSTRLPAPNTDIHRQLNTWKDRQTHTHALSLCATPRLCSLWGSPSESLHLHNLHLGTPKGVS